MRVLVLSIFMKPNQALLALGHDVVLFVNKARLSPDEPKAGYSQIVSVEKASREECIALARALHSSKPFQAVCSFIDGWQSLANAVAEALGLPYVVDPGALALSTNKAQMRARLAEAGVEVTPYRVVESKEDLDAALRSIGPTCIFKPIDGEASIGIAKLSVGDDIDAALERFHLSGHRLPALVETFLVGEEYSAEVISENGEHHLIAVTQKYKDPVTFVERGHVVPAPLGAEAVAQVSAHLRRALDALGFKSGPSHTEFILTAEGPRIVETHTRLGGDRIVDLVKHATEVDLCELTARLAVGESIAARLPTPVTARRAAANWYLAPSVSRQLVLCEVQGLAEVAALPGLELAEMEKQVGDRGAMVTSSLDRSGVVIATGQDGEEALTRARCAADRVRLFYRWAPESPPAFEGC